MKLNYDSNYYEIMYDDNEVELSSCNCCKKIIKCLKRIFF